MTEWDALSMLIRRKVLISSSHVIFRRYTHFHILSWDTFTLSRIWYVLCCLVVKCWHLGALPGLVESQYCFSFAASALLRSNSAEPEPKSLFANLPIWEESPFWCGENAATKEGMIQNCSFNFNFNFNYNALVLAFACFVKLTRLFQKNGHDENTECKTCPNQGKAL